MSSLVKSWAFVGLASEAKAMLLKKQGCSGGPALKDIKAKDMCGAMQWATADAKSTEVKIEKDGDGKFKITPKGGEVADGFTCAEVAICDPNTGETKTKEEDNVTKKADKGTVSDLFKYEAGSQKLADVCTGGNEPTKPGNDMCNLLKKANGTTAKAGKATAQQGSGAVGSHVKVKLNGESEATEYACAAINNCDKDTGLKKGSGGETANAAAVDAALDTNAPSPNVAHYCTPASDDLSLASNGLCGLKKAIADQASGSHSIEVVGGTNDQTIKVTIAGKAKDNIPCDVVKCNTDGSGTVDAASGVEVTPSSTDLELGDKAKNPTTNTAIAEKCASKNANWKTGGAPPTKSLCLLAHKLSTLKAGDSTFSLTTSTARGPSAKFNIKAVAKPHKTGAFQAEDIDCDNVGGKCDTEGVIWYSDPQTKVSADSITSTLKTLNGGSDDVKTADVSDDGAQGLKVNQQCTTSD